MKTLKKLWFFFRNRKNKDVKVESKIKNYPKIKRF